MSIKSDTSSINSSYSEGSSVVPANKPIRSKSKKAASAFRTISEVAGELDVQQHVLRFWETRFSQVSPLKRGGGRRYYRPEDVQLLKTIHSLLYTEGYTIKGVQKLLKEKGKKKVVSPLPHKAQASGPENIAQNIGENLSDRQRSVLKSMLDELKELRSMIKPVSDV